MYNTILAKLRPQATCGPPTYYGGPWTHTSSEKLLHGPDLCPYTLRISYENGKISKNCLFFFDSVDIDHIIKLLASKKVWSPLRPYF